MDVVTGNEINFVVKQSVIGPSAWGDVQKLHWSNNMHEHLAVRPPSCVIGVSLEPHLAAVIAERNRKIDAAR